MNESIISSNIIQYYIPLLDQYEFFVRVNPIAFPGIKPYYFVSNYGRVYSIYTNSFLAPQVTENGYLAVGLITYTGRIHRKIHRIAMMSIFYIPGCENLEVNHRDGNKFNNYIYNLEWNTSRENTIHAINNGLRISPIGETNPCAVINNQTARKIGEMLMQQTSYSEIANTLNIPNTEIIRNIAYGNTWSYLFTEDEHIKMRSSVRGYYLSIEQRHAICKYFEDHPDFRFVTTLVKDALIYIGVELSDRNIGIAKNLYYKKGYPEITSLYKY